MSVLVLERFSAGALARLRSQFDEVVFSEKLPEDISKTEALIIRSKTQVDESLLKKTPKLKVIVTATSGFDHIDLSLCKEKDIKVMYTPEANARSAAEMTWSLLLACSRKLNSAMEESKKNQWDRSLLKGTELAGKTIGIVGLGRVGKLVAKMANAFAMHVQYHDPFIPPHEDYESIGLIELFRASDIISLHVPLTEKTHHLLNHQTFAHFSNHPILINCSRGAVILEEALVQALDQNTISCAGLDVFEKEPLAPDSRLRNRENVICTPHVGATTTEAFEKASMEAAEKVIQYFSQGATSDLLPDSISWL